MSLTSIFNTVFALTFIALLPVTAAADKEKAAEFYEKGIQAYSKSQMKEAAIFAKNAIQQDSDYLAAAILLGKIQLKLGDGAAAEKELLRASQLGADKSLTLQPLAEAYLIQSKYAELLKQIPTAGYAPQIQADLLIARGDAQFELREYDEARASYEKAQHLNPSSPKPFLGLATLLINQGKTVEAEAQIARALDFDATSAQAWQLKAAIQYSQGNNARAIEFYSKALDTQPDHYNALLGRAGALLDSNELKRAQQDAAVLTEKYPLDPRSSYLKFSILRRLNQETEAQQALSDAYTRLQNIEPAALQGYAPLLLLAGVVSYEIKQLEKAYEYLTNYRRKFPAEPYADRMYATVLIARGADREAIPILESALEKQPRDYQLLTLLGTAYSNARFYIKANEMFDRAMQIQSTATPARLQKAFNELAANNRESAQQELTVLFDKNSDVRAGFMLILLYFRQQDMQTAESIARRLVKLRPDNLLARNFLAVAQLETGKLGESRKNFESILNEDENFFPAQINLAKLDMIANDLDKAERRLTKLLAKKQNVATISLALSQIARKKNDDKNALLWAEKAYAADKKNIPSILHLTELHLGANRIEQALRVAQDGIITHPDNFQIARALGRCYLADNKPDKARAVLRKMSEKSISSSPQLFETARLQNAAGDFDGSLWSLRKAIDNDSQYLPARLALIESLLSLNRINEVPEQLAQLDKVAPKNVYYRLHGDYQQVSKNFAQAVDAYKKSLQAKDDTDTAIRLYHAHRNNNDASAALQLMEQRLKSHPKDIRVQNVLADDYSQRGQWDKAAALYEKIIKVEPSHALALNNLANVYHVTGKPGALELARKAQLAAPDSALINDTLGWLLVESGKATEGLPFLRNANARAADNPEIRYHIAAALARLNRKDEARAELKALLDPKRGNFTSKKAAQALYDTLK